MVNLKALEAAIQKVETISDEELEFQAGDTRVTLRPLRPMEETAVQKWSRVAWEGADPDGDNAAFAEYLDRLRFGILGYSIVELDGLDLRDVQYLETGDVDDKGRPIEIPKHEALRDSMVREWSRMMLTEVYAKYTALTDRVEFRASQAVEYDPADLDDEIERLDKRLKDLREKKKKQTERPAKDPVAQEARVAGEINEAQRRSVRLRQDLTDDEVSDDGASDQQGTGQEEEGPQQESTSSQGERGSEQDPEAAGRRTSVPQSVSPRVREQQSRPLEEDPSFQQDSQQLPETYHGDSFFDPADPDSEDAIEAESRRQAELMRQHLDRKRQNEEETRRRSEAGLPTGPVRQPQAPTGQGNPRAAARVDPRTGGLRSAANASDAVFNAGPEQITTARPMPASLGGKPVYKMPTQTLDRPKVRRDARGDSIHKAPGPDAGVTLNPEGGSRNPRFRGPEGQ